MSMNIGLRLRVFFAILAATLLVSAMTLPSLAAPTKTMKFQVNSTGPATAEFQPSPVNTAPGSSTVSFWIRATNTTPGSGNPNSLRVVAPTSPSPGFVITNAVVDNTNSSKSNNPSYVIGGSGAFVDINGIAPLQQNQFITIRIDATTPAVSCPDSVQSSDWTGVLWTGSTVGSGQSFSTNSSSGLKTTLTPSCPTLEFVTAPQDAAKDTKITGTDFDPDGPTVQVAYKVNGSTSTALDGSTVTITDGETGSAHIVDGTATLSGGLASFGTLQINTANEPGESYSLTATVTGGPSTSPVAVTITPAGVCPGGVSGQVHFTTPEFNEPGDGTLNIGELTSTDCTGLDIRFTTPDDVVQQWSIELSKPDATAKITGYTTWTWDLPGTDPVPWTQVSWKVNVNNGPPLVSTNFVDLPRCNADAVNFPPQSAMPDPAADNPDYLALFPLVETSLGEITAGLCMYNSTLQVVGETYTEIQRIAINEDPAGRKG